MTNFLVQWGINPWGEDTLIHAMIRAQRYDEATVRLQARLDRREGPLDSRLLAETSSARATLAP